MPDDIETMTPHFRTLLTNVNGFAELLADPTRVLPDATRLEYAEIIHASGLRMAELLERSEMAGDK